MTEIRRSLMLSLCLVIISSASPAWSYDLAAHNAMSLAAARFSKVDDVLKVLGFPGGLTTSFRSNGESFLARDWIGQGAQREDTPDPRVVNHFHNPMSSWNVAGLPISTQVQGFSSLRWQQDANQYHGAIPWTGPGKWSWPHAQTRYYRALTLPSRSAREANLADLFRTLGQATHLVQDASLPAHTRGDSHLTLKFGLIVLYSDPDNYEKWVDQATAKGNLQPILDSHAPVRPSTAIFAIPRTSPRIDATSSQLAPSPVATLIDTGQYLGSNPDVTRTPTDNAPTIGLAEYSNANFFSKDTNSLLNESVLTTLLHPRRESMALGSAVEHNPIDGTWRRYFRKVPLYGDPIEHIAVPSALYQFLPEALKDKKIGLDHLVLQNYAAKLLPRAVGYSAALLDYFFRGRFAARFERSPNGQHTLTVRNLTPGEDMEGTFSVHYDGPDGTRYPLASWPGIKVGVDAEVTGLIVPASLASASQYLVVFRGRLGGEQDAVAIRWPTVERHVRIISFDALCTRVPFEDPCQITHEATGREVLGTNGLFEFAGPDTVATSLSTISITGPIYPGDPAGHFFWYQRHDKYRVVYVYRRVGGSKLRVTVDSKACAVTIGSLVSDPEQFPTSTWGWPGAPHISNDWTEVRFPAAGTYTTPVRPGPLLVVIGAFLMNYSAPQNAPGTYGDFGSSCTISSLQFVD